MTPSEEHRTAKMVQRLIIDWLTKFALKRLPFAPATVGCYRAVDYLNQKQPAEAFVLGATGATLTVIMIVVLWIARSLLPKDP